MPPSSHNPSVAGMGSHGGAPAAPDHHGEQDYHQLYETALKEAKVWEKKCSSAQNQIHYERERWEGKRKKGQAESKDDICLFITNLNVT